MRIARILQVVALLLAVALVFVAAYVSINFPLNETGSLSNKVTGMAYIALVAPVALLYLLISMPSTLFLMSKHRRAIYGFNAGPWRSVFWANVFVLIVLVAFQIVDSLVFVLFTPTT
jgi:hypothetical protein